MKVNSAAPLPELSLPWFPRDICTRGRRPPEPHFCWPAWVYGAFSPDTRGDHLSTRSDALTAHSGEPAPHQPELLRGWIYFRHTPREWQIYSHDKSVPPASGKLHILIYPTRCSFLVENHPSSGHFAFSLLQQNWPFLSLTEKECACQHGRFTTNTAHVTEEEEGYGAPRPGDLLPSPAGTPKHSNSECPQNQPLLHTWAFVVTWESAGTTDTTSENNMGLL